MDAAPAFVGPFLWLPLATVLVYSTMLLLVARAHGRRAPRRRHGDDRPFHRRTTPWTAAAANVRHRVLPGDRLDRGDSARLAARSTDAHDRRRQLGLSERQWQTASSPYMARMLATGRYPTLAKVIHDATFGTGLDCVLDGIAKQLGRQCRQ